MVGVHEPGHDVRDVRQSLVGHLLCRAPEGLRSYPLVECVTGYQSEDDYDIYRTRIGERTKEHTLPHGGHIYIRTTATLRGLRAWRHEGTFGWTAEVATPDIIDQICDDGVLESVGGLSRRMLLVSINNPILCADPQSRGARHHSAERATSDSNGI